MNFEQFRNYVWGMYGNNTISRAWELYKQSQLALWMARVLRAHTEKLFYFNLGMNTISEKWAWAERKCIDKCIEKAKEFE